MGVVLSKSLFIKQAVLTLLLAIVLSLVSSVIQVVEGIQDQKEQIYRNFQELLAVVEKPLTEAVFRLDTDFAQQQVKSLLFNPRIARVEIRDESGKLFVEANAPEHSFSVSNQFANLLLSGSDKYVRSLRLEKPSFLAGKLIVWPEKRYLVQEILHTHFSILLYNLVKDVLLASLISLVFYFLVTHPLERLTSSLSAIGNNVHQPLPDLFERHHKYDELGRLNATFSALWRKLNLALHDLERSNAHTAAMIEHAADGILLLNQDNQVTLVNATAEKMLGMCCDDLKDCSIETLHDTASWAYFEELLHNLPINSPLTVETTYLIQGKPLPVEIRLARYTLQDDIETLLLIRDVSERKDAERRIHRLAYYDSLTQLPNRQLLTDKLNEALLKQRNFPCFSAVVFIDLDRFKMVNDALGHGVGDQLLINVTQVLSPFSVENVMLARIGGDEFAFLMTELQGDDVEVAQKVGEFAQKILSACLSVKRVGRHDMHITASVGVTLFKGSEGSAETILKQVDTALYRAKEAGRNTFVLYRSDMQAMTDARLVMEKALHRATEQNLFEMYYQPQTNHLGELIGAEALIRWNDEYSGFIPPSEFIPIAEEIGLIVDIGSWVLDASFGQVAAWLKEGIWKREWKMSINVSPIQFQQADFLPMLKKKLAKYDIPPECIDLEITENMLLTDLVSCMAKMNAIKLLGIHLSVDDFGTGYSSLKYLKSLPIDRLKIDQSFVKDVMTDKSDEAIVYAVIAMAKALGVNVLAEGVETLAHYERLQEIGCFYYQGYFFGHPVPPSQFVAEYVHGFPVI